ncbi:DUF1990 family protein [Dietzia sp. 179-F 9C3 NHS]|uniref:DUF1990 family protein n=1 Tax=Dietzia sp. 179-F 9C3 NHS TaxID=3374295 RepID=UPI003879B26B
MTRARRFVREARLGNGRATLDRAGRALLAWEVHRAAGLDVAPGSPTPGTPTPGPVAPGLRVTLHPRAGPAAWLRMAAPCEVTEVVDDPDARGFTYRTLPGHPEHGTETFLVHRNRATDEVRFRIEAISRPGRLLVCLAGPLARAEQDRITRRYLDSARLLAI